MAELYFGDVSQRGGIVAYAKLLRRALARAILRKTAQLIPFPKNSGKTMIARRYLRQDPPSAPLTEGVTPKALSTKYEDVMATLLQWGAYIPVSDQAIDLHEDKLVEEHSKILSEQMDETVEKLDWEVIRGGTAVYYANGSVRSSVNTIISTGDLAIIERELRANYASYFREMSKGSDASNTEPIADSFGVYGHTDCQYDIEKLSGFVPVHKYGNPNDRIDMYEIGSVGRFRFILSPWFDSFPDAGGTKGTMKSTSGTKADVYALVVMTPDFWAKLDVNSMYSGSILVNKPKVQTGDELAQRGSVGWKLYHAAMILDDSIGARLEVAVTATPS